MPLKPALLALAASLSLPVPAVALPDGAMGNTEVAYLCSDIARDLIDTAAAVEAMLTPEADAAVRGAATARYVALQGAYTDKRFRFRVVAGARAYAQLYDKAEIDGYFSAIDIALADVTPQPDPARSALVKKGRTIAERLIGNCRADFLGSEGRT